MNCNGDNKVNKAAHRHSPLRHMLHMILCCGLPVLIIASLPFISKVSPGTSRALSIIAPFICPIMMIGMIAMMSGMRNNKKSICCENNENSSNTQTELSE